MFLSLAAMDFQYVDHDSAKVYFIIFELNTILEKLGSWFIVAFSKVSNLQCFFFILLHCRISLECPLYPGIYSIERWQRNGFMPFLRKFVQKHTQQNNSEFWFRLDDFIFRTDICYNIQLSVTIWLKLGKKKFYFDYLEKI